MKFDQDLGGLVYDGSIKPKNYAFIDRHGLIYSDGDDVFAYWNNREYYLKGFQPRRHGELDKFLIVAGEPFALFKSPRKIIPLNKNNKFRITLSLAEDAIKFGRHVIFSRKDLIWRSGDGKQIARPTGEVEKLGVLYSKADNKPVLCYATPNGDIFDAMTEEVMGPSIVGRRKVQAMAYLDTGNYKIQEGQPMYMHGTQVLPINNAISLCSHNGKMLVGSLDKRIYDISSANTSGMILRITEQEEYLRTIVVPRHMASATPKEMMAIEPYLEEA